MVGQHGRARNGLDGAQPPPHIGAVMKAFAALPILAVLAGLAAPAASARAAEQVAALTPSDRKTVAQVEHALDSIRTIKSHFIQSSSNGAEAQGTLWLSRPGNMRIDYAPPQHMKLVVQGPWLIQVDTKLETLTYVPLSRTPADMLVSRKIDFGGDVSMLGVEQGHGLVRVGLARRGSEDQGTLVVTMDSGTMALRQWQVTDPQGIVTTVTLTDPEVNITIDPQVFAFDTSKYDRNAIQ